MLPGALLAMAAGTAEAQQRGGGDDAAAGMPKITIEMIEQAAVIAGVNFTEAQRKVMVDGLTNQREDVAEIRKLKMPNAVAPSLVFDPVPGGAKLDTERKPAKLGPAPSVAGLSLSEEEKLAFSTVRQLAELLRTKKVTSVELTKMYLGRLRKYDPMLHFVITYTEERAMKQAAAADAEIAAGKHKGPLHGVPWGGKDLLAVAGYPTTWGAGGDADVRL
jgi:hypothetical protein